MLLKKYDLFKIIYILKHILLSYFFIILYYQKNCKEDPNSRCPMCQRLLYGCGEGGHIQSYSTGGKTELNNGLFICKRCNNNDKRNIFETMIEEYGPNHRNTKDFIKICKYLKKDIDYERFTNT